jgi:hypothetical protein
MAVLEHYPHSLNTFMGNTKRMLNTVGKLYLEVPNIAYWPKRTALLMGRTPLPPVEDIYLSEEPFIGHHHEFTMAELHELARLAGLKVTDEEYFNYTLDRTNTFKLFIRYPIMSAAFFLRARTRECIAVLCEKQDPLPV